MAAPVPAIHVPATIMQGKDVDARHKPGMTQK
jgi:hypothetical protein